MTISTEDIKQLKVQKWNKGYSVVDAPVEGAFLTTKGWERLMTNGQSEVLIALSQNYFDDLTTATLENVILPRTGRYMTGEKLYFVFEFDAVVDVTGSPRISLTIGANTRYATYESGTGTNILVFTYTVQSTDFDNNGVVIAANNIALNSGTIYLTETSTAATIAFTAANYTTGLTTVLTNNGITSIDVPEAGSYVTDDVLIFTVNFADDVTVSTTGGTPALTLTIGSTARTVPYVSGSGTSALVFEYTVVAGDVDADGVVLSSNIGLNSGTIKDTATEVNAVVTFTGSDYTSALSSVLVN